MPVTNPLERLNKEVKRRADVVGIFPCEASITRLIGAVLLEQNDEWQLQHRYMQVEAMAELTAPVAEAEPARDCQEFRVRAGG
jgi:transposase-like protein